MRRALTPASVLPLVPLCLALLGACSRERPRMPPPATEFLVSAGDSTYWVRTGPGVPVVRGSPILLARYDGRFYEVYVTDDDRSYEDAVFIGQRLWRRDIQTGDSLLVWQDSLIPRLAEAWGEAHPDSRRLEADEEAGNDPERQVYAELSVLDVHGPVITFEYHADIEARDVANWHTTRRGVIDLRTGRPATVSELFGRGAAQGVEVRARRAWLATLDSVRLARGEGARALAASIGSFTFDDASFSVTDLGGSPAIAFNVPGRGPGAAGGVTIPLPPLSVASPGWWSEVRDGLPETGPDSSAQRWTRNAYTVTAQADTNGRATLRLESNGWRWVVGSVQGPVHLIYWLDRPAIGSPARKALARAFDEAAFYDENVRTASWNPGPPANRKRSLPT
ncbi:MAG: hypothetical protein ACYC1S_06170 [Gemmatimonadaceae bacterium]